MWITSIANKEVVAHQAEAHDKQTLVYPGCTRVPGILVQT